MASWTAPRTWANGNLAAADMNVDIRDNLINVRDTLQIHGLTSDTVAQPLQSGHYGVSLHATGIAVTSGTDWSLDFTSEGDPQEWDDADFHDVAVNTARITAPVTGRYDFTGFASFEAHATAYRKLWFEKEGSTAYMAVEQRPESSNFTPGLHTSMTLQMTAGESMRLMFFQNSGSTLDVTTRFQARLVSV